MKKRKGSMLALLLAVSMLLSACGSAAGNETAESSAQQTTEVESTSNAEVKEESAYPEYLNLDSAYPVIKDEYADTIKLKVAYVVQPESGKWEDLWNSYYLKEKYNIELEVEMIQTSALAERKSLMMNSGELPDIIWNMAFTTEELTRYGVEEGMLLKCDEYINEELTPNIMHYMTEAVEKACTATDGHMYSLPLLSDVNDPGIYTKMFMNQTWLEELGLEMPRTLDEFTNALYAIKEADLGGVGSENVYPLAGGMEVRSVAPYLMNAFGYLLNDNNLGNGAYQYGLSPALRDGKAVIPVYDMEVFQEYLKLMNQYYEDGIINPNFFTIEETEVNAQLNNNQNAAYAYAVYTTGATNWADYESCYPLTSAWQEEAQAPAPQSCSVGGFVISADTEYPELCLRLADIFYNNETDTCRAFWSGSGEGTEWDSDEWVQAEWFEDKQNITLDAEKLPEGYSTWTYLLEYMHGNMFNFGAYQLYEAKVKHAADVGGNMPAEQQYDETNPDHQYRISVITNVMPYATEAYPLTYYVTDETAGKITDLESVLLPYVKEQVALFVTGERDLSETSDFVAELEGLGIAELQEIYTEIYANTLQN